MAFTYFFRDLQTLELIVGNVVRDFVGCSRVRVWDAGCAMGPEPYSLAMLFGMQMGRFSFQNLLIDASDIDNSDLFEDIIEQGIYPDEQLERIPSEVLDKYFRRCAKPGHRQLDESVRRRLRFRKHDLLSFKPFDRGYQLVLCKNVLLHFQPEERVKVIQMFHEVLVPGGYFAMEQTQKLPYAVTSLFEQVTPGAQLYRKL